MNQILDCRQTDRGAHTSATILRKPASILRFDESRSGNHWSEEIEVGDGGLVFVEDVSNTGKHRCYCLPETPLADVETAFGELPCGLPARLHTW